MSVLMAVIIVTVIGLLGAAILVITARFIGVEDDPRVEAVHDALPGANCGACGYAGCADYAGAIVEKGAPMNKCTPGGADTTEAIAAIMGGDAGEVEEIIAVVHCQGTPAHTRDKYNYSGVESCAASNALYGGSGECAFGCLGYGDCVAECQFDALEICDGIAYVDPDKCTGCGSCVAVCPKAIISLREKSDKVLVRCSNEQRGAQARKVCDVSCIGCTKCQRSCPEEAIVVENFLSRVDLEKCTACGDCVEACPQDVLILPKHTPAPTA